MERCIKASLLIFIGGINMKIVIVRNEDLEAFADKFDKDGEYELYKIIDVSWTGVAALFVLEGKE